MTNALPHHTLSEVLHRHADGPRSVSFIGSEQSSTTVSYADLLGRARSVLRRLQDAGLTAGDLMILFLDDGERFIETFWAAVLGGIVPVPVAVGLSDQHRQKLFRIYSHLGRPALFTDSRNLDRIAAFADESGLRPELDAMRGSTILAGEGGPGSAPGVEHEAQPDDTAFVQFSSGSTSDPKGIVLTHRNLLTNINAIIDWTKFTPADVSLSWMPLTHDMGLIGFHLSMMAAGMDQHLMPTELFIRHPLLWLKAAGDRGATILASPNFGYKHFLKSFRRGNFDGVDLSRVRMIVNGAEPISASLCNEFLDVLEPFGLRRSAMFPVYGLAEASLAVAFTERGSGVRSVWVDRASLGLGDAVHLVAEGAAGSTSFVIVGSPILDCEVRLAGESGAPVGEKTIGRVLIRGGNVTRGYFRDEAATGATIDGEGWLDTGDLGFFHEGELVITGRVKDVIFVHGQNYYPHDLELIAQQFAGAEMGKVVAAGARGPRSQGDELVLFVLHRAGLAELIGEAAALTRAIGTHAGVEVAHVIPVRRVPKTTSGKVQRHLLVRQYAEGEFDEVLAEIAKLKEAPAPDVPPRSEIERALAGIFASVETGKTMGIDDNFFEVGLSSLDLVQVFSQIDERWPGAIDITEIFDYPTIIGLAARLEETLTTSAKAG